MRSEERTAGYNAHIAWEKTRGGENECDAELTIRTDGPEHDVEWWNGWLDRSDEWRDEIGFEG